MKIRVFVRFGLCCPLDDDEAHEFCHDVSEQGCWCSCIGIHEAEILDEGKCLEIKELSWADVVGVDFSETLTENTLYNDVQGRSFVVIDYDLLCWVESRFDSHHHLKTTEWWTKI